MPSRRLAPLALSLAAVLVLAWRFHVASEKSALDAGVAGSIAPAPAAFAPERGEALELPAPEASAAASSAERSAVAAESPEFTSPTASARCRVSGRLIDEADRGIAGARVRLAAYRTWSEGIEVPRLEGPYDVRGFEVRSDERGAFELVAPPPTAERTSLEVEPDPFHDSFRLVFGAGDEPRLAAGERDLGEIRLASTGAIAGRVTDARGAPLEGAKACAALEAWSTLSRETLSGPDGSYRIDHVAPGIVGVNVEHVGHVSQFHEPIEVRAGAISAANDFALELAPTLNGRVVDESGNALTGAKLWGWPQSSGAGAGAKSGEDGRFTVYLPQGEPYSLECTLDGFEPFDAKRSGPLYAPGTEDIEVVLRRSVTTRFRVLDGGTDAPVERFGIRIEWNKGRNASPRDGSFTDARPRVEEHAGGELELAARPGLDRYQVLAPGYWAAEGEIECDAANTGVQTLRLERGGIVRGRAVQAGRMVEGARVVIESGARQRNGERWEAVTGTDGRFELSGIAAGGLRLTARDAQGAIAVRELSVPRGKRAKAVELGDVELLAPASIAGIVLGPQGVSVAGLKVGLDDRSDGIEAATDERGLFRFDGLTAGAHRVRLQAAPGRVAAGAEAALELAAGQLAQVELDARDRGVCRVTVVLRANGEPIERARISLRLEEGDKQLALGQTDDRGRAFGDARAAGRARVIADFPWDVRLEHPSAVAELVPGSELELVADFELGELAIELPASLALPKRGRASLVLRDGGEGEPVSASLAFLDGRAVGEWAQPPGTLDGHMLRLHGLPTGEFDAELTLRDAEDGASLIEDDERRLLHAERRLRIDARGIATWRIAPSEVH